MTPREQFEKELQREAEEYADRINNTLESSDARVRSFKSGYTACLNSTVVMELESACIAINEYLKAANQATETISKILRSEG